MMPSSPCRRWRRGSPTATCSIARRSIRTLSDAARLCASSTSPTSASRSSARTASRRWRPARLWRRAATTSPGRAARYAVAGPRSVQVLRPGAGTAADHRARAGDRARLAAAARRVGYLAFAAGRALGAGRADLVMTRDLDGRGVSAAAARAGRRSSTSRTATRPRSRRRCPNAFDRHSRRRQASCGAWRAREAHVWRRADGYVTITRGLAADLTKRLGPRQRLAVVHDGARLDGTVAGKRRRRRAPVTVVYAGHLYTWKGVDVLLDALARVPDVRAADRRRPRAGAGPARASRRRPASSGSAIASPSPAGAAERRPRDGWRAPTCSSCRTRLRRSRPSHVAAEAVRIHGRRPRHRRFRPAVDPRDPDRRRQCGARRAGRRRRPGAAAFAGWPTMRRCGQAGSQPRRGPSRSTVGTSARRGSRRCSATSCPPHRADDFRSSLALVRCPDCGASRLSRRARLRRLRPSSSRRRGVDFLDLRPADEFAEQTKYLDEALHADARHERVSPPLLGSKIRNDMLREFLRPSPGDLVVDLGCGSGRALMWNRDLGARRHRHRHQPVLLAPTRRATSPLLLGDLRRLPFADGDLRQGVVARRPRAPLSGGAADDAARKRTGC